MNIYGQCGMSTENDKITTPTEVFIDLQSGETVEQIVAG